MVQMATLRRRSWAGMVWLLIGSAAMVVALALGNTFVLLAALAAALISGWLLLGQAPARASSQPAARGAVEPRAQCSVLVADGMSRQALVVPAETVNGYRAVLTIDGYALANAEGRVVYTLSREAPGQTDDPVVVTIFDTAESSFEEELIAG